MKRQTGYRLVYINVPPGLPVTTDCPPPPHADHEHSCPACAAAPRPLPGSRPRLRLPAPDPAARPGGPGRALHRPPVRLGVHGHHLHAPAGGGTAVLQRVLHQRRAPRHELRGAVHVPDPHGDLRPGPEGNPG